MNISAVIGDFIKNKRTEKGYSQYYIAYSLQISQNAYSKIEMGKSKITFMRLIAIAKIMEFSVMEVISFIDDHTIEKPAELLNN